MKCFVINEVETYVTASTHTQQTFQLHFIPRELVVVEPG